MEEASDTPQQKAQKNWNNLKQSLKAIHDMQREMHKTRHESIEEEMLPEAAMQDIHSMRTQFWEEPVPQLTTTETALSSCCGSRGAWQVSALLPTKNALGLLREMPYNVRALGLQPDGRGSGLAHLAKCNVGALSIKGKKGEGDLSLGQDSCCVSRLNNYWEVFCVMDGHGPEGHWPSTRAARTLPFFLTQAKCRDLLEAGSVELALRSAFKEVQQDLEDQAHKEKVKIFLSGTTAVCALRHPASGSLWLAHVGDSRAVLLVPGRGAVRQTRDHSPRDESELDRVLAMGCELDSTTHDDGTVERRIFVKDKCYPGIMMTRSLGDLCVKQHGVMAVPEIAEWPLEGCEDAMLLLASDGVWEFLSTEQVTELVLGALERGKSNQEAVKELVEAAKASWQEHEEVYCDDVTVLLLPLDGKPLLPAPNPVHSSLCGAGVCRAAGACALL